MQSRRQLGMSVIAHAYNLSRQDCEIKDGRPCLKIKGKRQIRTGGAAQWQSACEAYTRPWIQCPAAWQRRWQGEAAAVITTSAQRSYIISAHLQEIRSTV